MKAWIRWTALGVFLLLLMGCQTRRQVTRPPAQKARAVQMPALDTPQEKAQGFYHVVKKGETLWRICKAYGADLQQVAEINNIKDPSQIREGQKIFIPGASGAARVEVPKASPGAGHGEAEPKIELYGGKLIWPVRGQISSSFGVRNGMKHSGIDITAPMETPVVAAADGEVIFKGTLRGYGNILILRHSEDLATVYAHLSQIHVSDHQHVRQGETVGTVGNSGQSEGAHLHFEVRVRNVARNPLFYLSEDGR